MHAGIQLCMYLITVFCIDINHQCSSHRQPLGVQNNCLYNLYAYSASCIIYNCIIYIHKYVIQTYKSHMPHTHTHTHAHLIQKHTPCKSWTPGRAHRHCWRTHSVPTQSCGWPRDSRGCCPQGANRSRSTDQRIFGRQYWSYRTCGTGKKGS